MDYCSVVTIILIALILTLKCYGLPDGLADSESYANRFQFLRRTFEAKIDANARHFIPPFRLLVEDALTRSEPDYSARNFTFLMDANASVPFVVHPASGIIHRNRDPETLTNIQEANFRVALYVDGTRVDECDVRIRIRARTLAESNDGHAPAGVFRFEQPVYAFAVGPGSTSVGRVAIRDALPTVTYAIAEGGATYFQIDPQSGEISYRGPLERNAKNYTIKAVAYDPSTELIESTSVQVLVAGISSSPPQIPKRFEVVELLGVRGVDFDPDARLHYRVVDATCLSVLGQDADCVGLLYFAGQGHRNGTLMFAGDARNAYDGIRRTGNDADRTMDALALRAAEFLREKTRALASILVNVSVSDEAHPLEPSDYASLLIHFAPKSASANAGITGTTPATCRHRFNLSNIEPEIHVDDSLPPNSYLYTITMCSPAFIDQPMDAVEDSSRHVGFFIVPNEDNSIADELFAIQSDTGVLRNVGSLRNAPRRTRLKIEAREDVALIDTIEITVVCESRADSALEFAEKFYTFNMTTRGNSTVVGRVALAVGGDHNALHYEIIDLNRRKFSLFSIDDQGSISAIAFENFDEKSYQFFVRATNSGTGKSAIVPVLIQLDSSRDLAVGVPRFGAASPLKATVMENAPVGTFVASLDARGVQRFEIRATAASGDAVDSPTVTKLTRLVDALTVSADTLRTFASLSGLAGVGYRLTVVAYGSEPAAPTDSTAQLEIELDVLPVSKCVPKFAAEQKLVFDVTDTKPGASVARVRADVERGCELVYELDAADNSSLRFGFEMHEDQIRVAADGLHPNGANADGYGGIRFPLIVVARSGHVSARIGVELRLWDASTAARLNAPEAVFDAPQLRYRIADTFESGGVVARLRIRAHACRAAQYALLEGDDFLALNATDGTLRTTRDIDAPREFLSALAYRVNDDAYESIVAPPVQHRVRVRAICGANSNPKSSRPTDVIVEIVDVNTNSPQFEKNSYEFSVDSNEIVGTVIGRVRAFDRDISDTLEYELEHVAFYRNGVERRVRESLFDVDDRTGDVRVAAAAGALADFVGGYFALEVRVRDAPHASLSMHSATASVQLWIVRPSDLIGFVLDENPRHVNETKIADYFGQMAAAITSALRPRWHASTPVETARVILHDARYHFADDGREIFRNSTVLRALFVAGDAQNDASKIVAASDVEKAIRDLTLPGLKPLADAINSETFNNDAENEVDSLASRLGASFMSKKAAASRSMRVSPLLVASLVFGALLATLFIAFVAALCYYRQRFLREQKFLRDAQIASATKTRPSTLRRFALAAERAAHFYPPNPYINDSWEGDSKDADNFYYSTQEMKISMR